MKTFNSQPSTPNLQVASTAQSLQRWKLNVKCSAFLLAVLLALLPAAQAQTTSTVYTNCLNAPVVCQHTVTNLAATLYNTTPVWQGRNLGIGVSLFGGAGTNTGTVGLQFAVKSRGANGVVTTTKPFTVTTTANGVTPVTDWIPLPAATVGPADALVLMSITNAFVNANGGFTSGSVTVSNVWLQYDTRP